MNACINHKELKNCMINNENNKNELPNTDNCDIYSTDMFMSDNDMAKLQLIREKIDKIIEINSITEFELMINAQNNHSSTINLCKYAAERIIKTDNISMMVILMNHYDNNPEILDFCTNRCSCYGSVSMLQLLIDHGADIKPDKSYLKLVETRNKYTDGVFYSRLMSPFINSCKSGNIQIVKFILDNNIDSNDINDINNGLCVAIWADQLQVSQILIDEGANVNYQNAEALKQAIRLDRSDAVKLLLQNGVDVSLLNKNKLRDDEKTKIGELLISEGCDPLSLYAIWRGYR